MCHSETNSATMKDVAKKAGVSTATVSRALMNPEKVSVPTRQKVEKAIIAVGYAPHTLMRNSKRSESRTILVIVPNICDPFFSEIIRGIESVAASMDYLVILGDWAHQQQQTHTFADFIFAQQIDGIILLGSQLPFTDENDDRRMLLPMVMANEFVPGLQLPTVHIDNLTAAFEAVNYLLGIGHRRVACIAGPQTMPLCQFRLQGYIQALRRNNRAVDPRYIVRGDFSFEAGRQALQTLLELPEPPDALFCHNDMMALGAMAEAKARGLRIPQDISLFGFDDIELSCYSDPPLSTVAQPRFDIGREAMQLLLDRLQGHPVNGGSRLLNFTLKIRGSTATDLQQNNL